MHGRTWRAAAPALGLALLVAACGSSGEEKVSAADEGTAEETVENSVEETTAAAVGECTTERMGGEVTLGTPSQTPSLDPAVASGTATTGGLSLIQIYDTLMQYDTKTGEYEPRLAKSLKSSDDSKTWTLTLRDGITFTSGNPLDAAAVKASIERYIAGGTSHYVGLAKQITSMEAVDDLTLVFTLEQPWAGFPFLLANTPGMIVDTQVAKAAGEGFGREPSKAGAGPYEVTRFAASEEIVLTAKSDYWGGPVCIEELRIVPMAADAGRYQAFQAGDFQATYLRDPAVVAEALAADIPGLSTYKNAANVLLLNLADGKATSDLRVRTGVAKAIDVEKLDQRVNQGNGIPTKAVLAETSVYHAEGMHGVQYDPEGATKLFDEAKADGWDGSLNLLCATKDQAVAIQAFLEAAGAEVELDIVTDLGALVERVFGTQNFELSCWGNNVLDGALWATLNPSYNSQSKANPGGYADEGMDQGLAELRVASGKNEVQAAMRTIQKRWNATVPSVVLNANHGRTIHTEDLKGLVATSNSLVFFSDAYLVD